MCFSIFPQKPELSMKVFQDNRRRLLQPRSRPRGFRLAAGTRPGASPASSSAELQLIHLPHIQSSLSLISSSAPAICVCHRSRIRCGTGTGLVPILKCIVLIPLSRKLFCTVFNCLILMEALYVFVFTQFRLCLCCPTILKGYKDHIRYCLQENYPPALFQKQ